jgi:hypothetical protein
MTAFFAGIGVFILASIINVAIMMILLFTSKKVRDWTINQIKVITKECVEFLDELDKEL